MRILFDFKFFFFWLEVWYWWKLLTARDILSITNSLVETRLISQLVGDWIWPHDLGEQIAINQKTKRLATWILGNFTLIEFDKFEQGFPHCSENRVP